MNQTRERSQSPTWIGLVEQHGHEMMGKADWWALTRENRLVKRRGDLDLRSRAMATWFRIYKVTCKTSGKSYVGQTVRPLHDRWRAHCLKGSRCWGLAAAIRKYGKADFTVVLLDKLRTADEANASEKREIHEHDTLTPNGYNLYLGGGGPNHGHLTDSQAKRKAWQDPEKRARHMAWRTPEKMSAQANCEEQWKAQQLAWLKKRLATALAMDSVDDAIKMIAYRTTKTIEHARRQGKDDARIVWMRVQEKEQIEAVCAAKGVPVPPASSCKQTAHEYERQLAEERGWHTGE